MNAQRWHRQQIYTYSQLSFATPSHSFTVPTLSKWWIHFTMTVLELAGLILPSPLSWVILGPISVFAGHYSVCLHQFQWPGIARVSLWWSQWPGMARVSLWWSQWPEMIKVSLWWSRWPEWPGTQSVTGMTRVLPLVESVSGMTRDSLWWSLWPGMTRDSVCDRKLPGYSLWWSLWQEMARVSCCFFTRIDFREHCAHLITWEVLCCWSKWSCWLRQFVIGAYNDVDKISNKQPRYICTCSVFIDYSNSAA